MFDNDKIMYDAEMENDGEKTPSAQELLEQIFYYMNCLVEEKDFYKSLLLLTELGKTMVNSERASFWYKDEAKGVYKTLIALDENPLEVPMGRGVVGTVIEGNKPVISNNPYLDENFYAETDWDTGFSTHSILCVPVTNDNGEVIGAFQAINKIDNDGLFENTDIDRLSLASAYCGKIFEGKLILEENRIDALTGLKNRKGFYDSYAINKDKHISIIMCDVDYFKKVNDTYGHNVGDAVLVHVSDIMKKCVHEYPKDDTEVFRWGGEEFIILMPEVDVNRAAKFAESLRLEIEENGCYAENNMINVTMSFGVAEILGEDSLADNIKEADEYLYVAKRKGRNRVVWSLE